MSFANVPAEIFVAITDHLTLGELTSMYKAFYGKGVEGKILTLQIQKLIYERLFTGTIQSELTINCNTRFLRSPAAWNSENRKPTQGPAGTSSYPSFHICPRSSFTGPFSQPQTPTSPWSFRRVWINGSGFTVQLSKELSATRNCLRGLWILLVDSSPNCEVVEYLKN